MATPTDISPELRPEIGSEMLVAKGRDEEVLAADMLIESVFQDIFRQLDGENPDLSTRLKDHFSYGPHGVKHD